MTNPTMIYSTWPTGTTVIASTHASGYAPENIFAATEDTAAVCGAGVGQDFFFDCLSAYSANCFAVAGDIPDGVTVKVFVSTDNVVWDELVETNLVAGAAAWGTFTLSTSRYWRFKFTVSPLQFDILHLALAVLAPWPYFSEDYEPTKLHVEGSRLLSAAGYNCGGVTESAMRRMPIVPGAVSDSECAVIAAFADNVIRYQRGCFFVPQISESTIYFGSMADTDFSAPYKNGLRHVAPMTFETRAT